MRFRATRGDGEFAAAPVRGLTGTRASPAPRPARDPDGDAGDDGRGRAPAPRAPMWRVRAARACARGARGVGFRREKGTFSQPSRGCPVQVPENRGRGPTFAYFAFAYARLRNHGLKSPTHHHRYAEAASRRFPFASSSFLTSEEERRGGSRRGYFLAPFWSCSTKSFDAFGRAPALALVARAPVPRPPPLRLFSSRRPCRPLTSPSAVSSSAWRRRRSACRSRCGRRAWGRTGARARWRRSGPSTGPAA